MSIVAQMEGLPANADANAVVLAVRKILQKLKIKFWVQDFVFSAETNKKKCKIEFFTKQDATKAIDKITCKPHTIVGVPCDLKITIVSEHKEEGKKKELENRRDRSRSPISKEEANINKELEQLKKEKQELEKRKNELLKKKMDIDQEPNVGGTTEKQIMKPVKIQYTTLPKCSTVETTLMDQMKILAKPYLQNRSYHNFTQRMLIEIRMRLAMLFESSKVNRASRYDAIMKEYRSKYPRDKDLATVEYIMSQVKLAFWAYRPKNKDGTNTDPYVYEESEEEEDTAVEDKGEENVVDMVDNENKEETSQNDDGIPAADAITEDNNEATTEENNEAITEDNNEAITEDNNEAMTKYNNEAITEDNSEAITEYNNEAMTEGNNTAAEIAFEDGTDWNEETDKVTAVAS